MAQRWLGHADIRTTAIYSEAVGQEERNVAQGYGKMNNTIFGEAGDAY